VVAVTAVELAAQEAMAACLAEAEMVVLEMAAEVGALETMDVMVEDNNEMGAIETAVNVRKDSSQSVRLEQYM